MRTHFHCSEDHAKQRGDHDAGPVSGHFQPAKRLRIMVPARPLLPESRIHPPVLFFAVHIVDAAGGVIVFAHTVHIINTAG